MLSIRCAECQCDPHNCTKVENERCIYCTKDVCCCVLIHNTPDSNVKNSFTITNTMAPQGEDCCISGSCKNDAVRGRMITSQSSGVTQFFRSIKGLYAAALGIEILCIAAAEIGENTGLYLFGFNLVGILIAYAMGYALAGFTTFATILGRHNYYASSKKIDSCCSVLELSAGSGFLSNLKTTLRNFAVGLAKMPQLYGQPNLKYIMKTSLYILITAESACILTAETVDLIFYQYSIVISIPVAIFAGAFAVVAPEAHRKIRHKTK